MPRTVEGEMARSWPEEWAEDKERRRRAGVPEEVGIRTKPTLAREMLGRDLSGWLQ